MFFFVLTMSSAMKRSSELQVDAGADAQDEAAAPDPKRPRTTNREDPALTTAAAATTDIFIAPKDVRKNASLLIGDLAFEGRDEDSESDFLDDDDGENIRKWEATLYFPYARCWSREDAGKMFPDLSDAEYQSGEFVVGRMKMDVVPGHVFDWGVNKGNWGAVVMELDSVSQSLYDVMNACTNIEQKSDPDNDAATELAVFRSFDVPKKPPPTAAERKEREEFHAQISKTWKEAGLGDPGLDLDSDFMPGMIHVDRVEITDARFRNHGYGKLLINGGLKAMHDLEMDKENGPVYGKPFPLQWEKTKGEDGPTLDSPFTEAQKRKRHEDTLRLMEFWKKLGFKEVGGSVGGGFDGYAYGYLVRGMVVDGKKEA